MPSLILFIALFIISMIWLLCIRDWCHVSGMVHFYGQSFLYVLFNRLYLKRCAPAICATVPLLCFPSLSLCVVMSLSTILLAILCTSSPLPVSTIMNNCSVFAMFYSLCSCRWVLYCVAIKFSQINLVSRFFQPDLLCSQHNQGLTWLDKGGGKLFSLRNGLFGTMPVGLTGVTDFNKGWPVWQSKSAALTLPGTCRQLMLKKRSFILIMVWQLLIIFSI